MSEADQLRRDLARINSINKSSHLINGEPAAVDSSAPRRKRTKTQITVSLPFSKPIPTSDLEEVEQKAEQKPSGT